MLPPRREPQPLQPIETVAARREASALIVTRTPVRVSFLGGGTDYPDHYREHGGQTLGAAIDKYSYVTINRLARLFEYRIRVSYSRTELVRHAGEIEHPAVRECLLHAGIDSDVEIHYVGDLPARTGLGSSSSFTVGLLHALYALRGEAVDHARLAREAVHVEHQRIRERIGVQDQYTCAHGGLVRLRFGRDGTVSTSSLELRPGRLEELRAHLLLVYTGVTRMAHDVLDEQLERTRSGAVTGQLKDLASLVDQGAELLQGEAPLAAFGELLHAAWLLKRQLSTKVSNARIDECYATARGHGAVGGKLLGAGSGGFLLLVAPPDTQDAVIDALKLPRIDFSFDGDGSVVLLSDATSAPRSRRSA